MTAEQSEGYLGRTRKTRLYWQHWPSVAPPRAVVVLVHGVGEHCGRYLNIARPLSVHGYSVWGYDQRGHGRSMGRRIHVRHWGEYAEDLLAVLDFVKQTEMGLPLFLYGHSMGALVVLDFLLQHSDCVEGVVVSGAPINPAGAGSPLKIAVARALSRCFPVFPISLNIDQADLSRDPDVVDACRNDPLVTWRCTARWGSEILAAIARVKARASSLAVPMLLLHGEADRLNLPAGSRFLADAVTGAKLRLYPKMLHEPHNDPEHERVVEDVRQWLDEQTAAGPRG